MTLKKHGANRDRGFYPKGQGKTITPLKNTKESQISKTSKTTWIFCISIGIALTTIFAALLLF